MSDKKNEKEPIMKGRTPDLDIMKIELVVEFGDGNTLQILMDKEQQKKVIDLVFAKLGHIWVLDKHI